MLFPYLSVQFSRLVMSDSLQPPGLQHTRLLCPSTSPRAYSNSCPLSQWHNPTISSSVVPFSSSLQSFPAPGSFPMSQFFASGEFQLQHQSFQWIFRTNILYNWLVWSPGNPGSLKSLSQQHSSKTSILWCSAFCMVQLSHPQVTTGKNHSFH